MTTDATNISTRLSDLVHSAKDGYAIFNQDEYLIYCNQAFAEIMMFDPGRVGSITLETILRENFANNRGVRIDSGDIEQFITYTKQVRRSRVYRLFEVDFVDSRWFLFSEQVNEQGDLLMQLKDITSQKVQQQSLEARLDTISELALTDELTRVANRRSLIQSVVSELSRCKRSGVQMTMLLLDIDFFKQINDTYGHQVGDLALQHVANLIKNSLRPFDIMGRIGGEEFAVFLSNTPTNVAFNVAERTCDIIANNPLVIDGQSVAMTISIGLATEGCDTSFEKLFEQADEALYQSKHNGRNRVTIYQCVD